MPSASASSGSNPVNNNTGGNIGDTGGGSFSWLPWAIAGLVVIVWLAFQRKKKS